MKIKNMGVDLGTSSMGIARYKQADDGEYYLIDVESVIFDEPVINDSKGVRTKNTDRRDSRLRSRQVDRTKARHKKLRHLFPLLGVSPENIENNRKQNPNIFQLRALSVDAEISLTEFARVLAHVNNNRGYKGNLKSSGGVVNKNIKALEEMLAQENLQTIGQLWCAKQQESGNAAWKHQSAGNGEESPGTYMTRTMVEKEFHLIWDKQAEYHSILNEKAPGHIDKYFKDLPQDATLKDIFFHAIFYQRPIKWNFDTVGDCPFEEGLKRAAIAHPAFQEYRIAKKLLDIRLTKRNQSALLSEAQMQQLYNMLNDPSQPYNENGEISYNHIYKALEIDENLRFNMDKRANNENNQGIKGNQSLYAFYRAGILTEFQGLSQDAQDILIDFLSHQTDYNILLDADVRSLQAGLKEVRREAAKDTQIAVIRFIQESICPVLEKGKTLDLETGRASYSKKLLSILSKRLRLGETENSILQDLYGHEYTRKAPTGKLKSVNTVLTKNPIIDRVLREYKTKMDYYVDSNHMPNQLSIEVSRELKNSLAMRNFIDQQQKDYQKDINEAKKELLRQSISINGHNILRCRLWMEGDNICPYCGQNMGVGSLQTAEIDHIIPVATNGPNRYFNKVLCHSNCNNEKSNNTPYQAVEQKIINEGALKSFAENLKNKAEKIKKRPAGHKWIKPLKKRDLEKKAELLLTTKTGEELFDFSERQQNETAWIGKIVLDWSNDISQKKPVATRGALTAHLRHIWGIDTLLAEIRISEGKILFSKHKEKGKNTVLPPAAYEELYLNEIPENDADSYFYALWQKENPKISLKKYRQQQKSNPQYQFDKRCDHRHHAIDAAIIGLCDHSMLQRASKAGGLRRVVDNCGNEIHKGFYPEDPKLRARLKQLLTEYVVWHKPDRFPNKAFFQETAYGVIKQKDGLYPFSRKKLSSFLGKNDKETSKKLESIIDGELKKAIIQQYQQRTKQGMNHKDALLGKDANDGIFYQKNKVKKARCYLMGKSEARKISENFLLLDPQIKGKQIHKIDYDTVIQQAETLADGAVLNITAYDNNGYACMEFYPNAKRGEVSKKAISVFEYQQQLKEYQKINPKAQNLPLEEEGVIRIFENETIFDKTTQQFYYVGSFHGQAGLKTYLTTEIKVLNEAKSFGDIKKIEIIRTQQQLAQKLKQLRMDK